MKTIALAAVLATALAPGLCPAEEKYADASKVEISKDYVQELAVRSALGFLGTPYVYAGVTRKGVDCSGLVYAACLEAAGATIPRGTEALFAGLPAVTGPLLPGDLVFFNTTGGVSHVGMALGGERIIHAASRGPKTGVIISSLTETYYRTRYLGARRVFEYTAPAFYVTLGGTRIGTVLAASLEAGRPFTLSVAHRRAGGKPVVCRLQRKDGKERREVKQIPIPPGKETLATCSFDAAGDWFVSFTEDKTGEILRIEVRVERSFDSRPSGK
jgi:hypothetical protein